jgi:RNA polymerase sigma factor (sigma-70 family)
LTAPGAFAASSAVFNDRRRFSMGETAQGLERRTDQIAALYKKHAVSVERLVSRRASVPWPVIEDACQTAWGRLCSRDDVDVETSAAVRWLVVVAVHEAWRYTERGRELPVGVWLTEVNAAGELPEPSGRCADPLVVTVGRDDLRRRPLSLTPREWQFLGLQVAGLSYAEIAARLGVTVRTVERQIVRGRRKLRRGGDGVDA